MSGMDEQANSYFISGVFLLVELLLNNSDGSILTAWYLIPPPIKAKYYRLFVKDDPPIL